MSDNRGNKRKPLYLRQQLVVFLISLFFLHFTHVIILALTEGQALKGVRCWDSITMLFML